MSREERDELQRAVDALGSDPAPILPEPMSLMSPDAAATTASLRAIETQLLDLLDEIAANPALKADRRWLAIGRTSIEQGVMSVDRAVLKPERR